MITRKPANIHVLICHNPSLHPYVRWGHLPEDDCSVSEIRSLIQAARQDRVALATSATSGNPSSSPYNPRAASAPPATEEYKEDFGNPPFGPSSPEVPLSCEYDHQSGSSLVQRSEGRVFCDRCSVEVMKRRILRPRVLWKSGKARCH